MADKTIEIELTTAADLTGAEELRDIIDEIQSAVAEDVEMKSNAEDVAGEFDDLGDSASGAKDSVDDLQSSMDLLEAGALMGISSELAGLGAGAESMAQDMNTAAISVGQLATNTNVAEPQMVSLINNISNATFPQDEAMAYVSALNQMGVSADQLGNSATNMDKINDATGIGYSKVIQLTQGLRSMGIEGANLPSSFNAIAFAQANVTGGADTLSTVLKRQAGTINEYGLSVDQVVLIMQKLSESGVQPMQMGKQLSAVLKETNGDTQALEQSLGLAAGTLSNAGAATGQYEGQLQTLANEEAEHKTWLDQINAAWEDMQLSLSPVLMPLTSVMGLIGDAGSFAVGFNGLIQLANTMRGLSIVTYAKAAADYVASGAQWALNIAMSMNPIGILIIAIVGLIAVLGYLYFNNEKVRNAVNALGAAFMSVVNGAINFFKNAVQGIPQALQQCLDWARDLIMNHPIVQAIIWLGDQISWAFSALGLGQSSPGKIVKAMKNELDWTSEVIHKNSLVNDAASLGGGISGAFNPDFETGNAAISNGGNASQVNNFYFSDIVVDNEDRMQKIADYIARNLFWNNKTAGRSV